MLELLKRLAAAEPELCTGPYEGNGIYYFTIGGYRFSFAGGKLTLCVYTPGLKIGESGAAWWLQGILQQAIEARGWFLHLEHLSDWSFEAAVITPPGEYKFRASTAAEALLAAYVAAVESEER